VPLERPDGLAAGGSELATLEELRCELAEQPARWGALSTERQRSLLTEYPDLWQPLRERLRASDSDPELWRRLPTGLRELLAREYPELQPLLDESRPDEHDDERTRDDESTDDENLADGAGHEDSDEQERVLDAPLDQRERIYEATAD
jgi:hypothetical protein